MTTRLGDSTLLRKHCLGTTLHLVASHRVVAVVVALVIAAAACAPTDRATTSGAATGGAAPSAAGGVNLASERGLAPTKAISIATLNGPGGFGVGRSGTSPVGGWGAVDEVHSNGLFTSELTSRKVGGLLVEKVPEVEDGSITVLPDGRMRVVYSLRKGLTWQDGSAFSAEDLAFTTRMLQDPGLTLSGGGQAVPRRIGSVETPDPHTFVAYFRAPYYQAASLSLTDFWPQPRHILEPVYERYRASGNAEELINHPYWTSEYVHLGPFRLVSWDPSREVVFEAHEGYFRGRPNIQTIRVQVFLDVNALFASLLAGASDVIFENTIDPEQGAQLEQRWRATGDGVAFLKPSNVRVLIPQHRPAYQLEPANLEPRVRAALYHALDREELAEGLQAGHRETAAWGLLLPEDPMHRAIGNVFRQYSFDPGRARAILEESGWRPGPDGVLRHTSDGRRFRNAITGPPDYVREISAFADYWRRIGVEVEEQVVPSTMVRNAEFRSTYGGWEATAGGRDFSRLQGPAARAENRWVGNRGGYDDPRVNALLETFETSITDRDQLRVVGSIAEIVGNELPLLGLFYTVEYIAVRRGVTAFQEDHTGGFTSGNYGTYARNAYRWNTD